MVVETLTTVLDVKQLADFSDLLLLPPFSLLYDVIAMVMTVIRHHRDVIR